MLHEVYCLFDSELECQGYLQQSQTSEKIYASSCCLLRKHTGHGRSGRRYVSRKAIHSCTSNYLFKFCFSQLQINIRDKKWRAGCRCDCLRSGTTMSGTFRPGMSAADDKITQLLLFCSVHTCCASEVR